MEQETVQHSLKIEKREKSEISGIKDVEYFKEGGAHGLVKKGNAIQIIVGLSVPQVKAKFEDLLKKSE